MVANGVVRPCSFVATKRADQLDLQALHRVRERFVGQRTIFATFWRPNKSSGWVVVQPERSLDLGVDALLRSPAPTRN